MVTFFLNYPSENISQIFKAWAQHDEFSATYVIDKQENIKQNKIKTI